jgi:hypothetical protein
MYVLGETVQVCERWSLWLELGTTCRCIGGPPLPFWALAFANAFSPEECVGSAPKVLKATGGCCLLQAIPVG